MKKSISLLLALLVCILLVQYPRAESADAVIAEEDTTVKVVLTKLDVNDQTLEVGLKIINNTDHDVWVCNGYPPASSSRGYFDRFMAKDDRTLVLRRRYNLSSEGLVLERPPTYFRYLRLRPGQEKVESHSFILPVTPTSRLFQTSSGGLNVESAQRLAIEIGFYDEDLRALILGVVDVANSLGWDASAIIAVQSESASAVRLYHRFFGGFEIAGWFKNRTWFSDSVTSDSDEILMPPVGQSLNGEQVLRIEVDNLPIPFSLY